MDGIAGMIPLQMFKVDPTRLPLGYKANSRNLAFIVDSESQKINQNQDWTVQVSGQMVFLNSEDIPEVLQLLKTWRKLQGRKNNFLLDWGYTN